MNKVQFSRLELFMMTLIASALAVMLNGCTAGTYSAMTKATVTRPDGSSYSYESNKEQQGLSLELTEQDGKITGLKMKVDKADTQQEAIAAALQSNIGLQGIIQGLIAKGAAGGK